MNQINTRLARDTIQRLLVLLDYVDSCNVEPAGPSRNRDFHLIKECTELTELLGKYAQEAGYILRQ